MVSVSALYSQALRRHIPPMANPPTKKTKAQKARAKPPRAKAHRPDVQPIGPALAELRNTAIGKGEAGIGSGTGLKPPPDNSKDRRAGGEAAAHLARKSTPKDFPGHRLDANEYPPPQPSPPQPGSTRVGHSNERSREHPTSHGEGEKKRGGVRADPRAGFNEAPAAYQANYGTAATIPTMDPELAKQLGLDVEDDDTLARPARNKMEALGVAATAGALEALLREGRPEFKKDDGSLKVWAPHRPPRPEKSEGGVRFVIKSDYEPKGDQPAAIAELVEGISRNERSQVLLGVTGSGKTYTMAKVIEATQRPAILLAPK